MNRKGITPIIAIVLLLMMTVAAAAAAYFWMTTVQRRIMEAISAGMEERIREVYLSVKIVSTQCDDDTDEVIIYVQNVGVDDVPSGDYTITVLDAEGGSVASGVITGVAALPKDQIGGPHTLTGVTGLADGETYTVSVVVPGGAEATDVCKAG